MGIAGTFDIDRFMEGSGKVDLSDIDWSDVPKHPVTPEALRTLRYFMNTENATFFYVKTLMQTKAPFVEPELAPFLSAWVYEEEFHGRAFRKFLEAYGDPVDRDYRANLYRTRGVGERVDELGQRVLSALFADAWPAVHMTWGVVQEWTTYMAYQSLIERVSHPILHRICHRIMKQELRHFAFYREQARRRLRSPAVQKVVTAALKIGWTPVGDGMSSKLETIHAVQFLFDGMDGEEVSTIDRKMRELPGLEWFDLFTRYVTRHQIPKAPASWLQQGAPPSEPPIAAIGA
jgi:rubrerythrin